MVLGEGGANTAQDRESLMSFSSSAHWTKTKSRPGLMPKTRPSVPDELLVISALDEGGANEVQVRVSLMSFSSSTYWTKVLAVWVARGAMQRLWTAARVRRELGGAADD